MQNPPKLAVVSEGGQKMRKEPLVSIIIPVGRQNDNLNECLDNCIKLEYPHYEIIVLPDEEFEYPDKDIRIIPTGKIGPAEKRNIGVKNSKGEIIAFIDDDTYPRKDWLNNIISDFSSEDVAAIGGPAITPPNDSMLQKASGAVYESFMGGGFYTYRYIPQRRQYVDDYPSCNFIVRKDILEKIGGFKTNYWPGEDTALCLEIVHTLSKKILYDPTVLLYHHRRKLFKGHLKQVKAYALHRGYFAKRFPKTSLRVSYFLPTLFILFLLFGWIINPLLYRVGIITYVILLLISVWKFENIRFLTLLGIISTHITYGIWFVLGLLSIKLKEEKQ